MLRVHASACRYIYNTFSLVVSQISPCDHCAKNYHNSQTMDRDLPESSLSLSSPIPAMVFRLMDLPPELREEVYYHASPSFPPLETSQPDVARVPAIAQLSRQTRKEALAVFYRNRDVTLNLRSDPDIMNATGWLDSCARNAELSHKITIDGHFPYRANFSLIISCQKKDPQFSADVQLDDKESRRNLVKKDFALLESQVTNYLENKTSWRPEDRRGRLTVGEMRNIVNVVRKITGCA